MSEDFGFAAPPFDAEAGLARLQRELRQLGLSEREGAFQRRDLAWARASLEDGVLGAALARQPARRPDWQPRQIRNNAELRDFVAALKRRLAESRDKDD